MTEPRIADLFRRAPPDYMLVAPDSATQEEMQQARDAWLGAIADGKPPMLKAGWRIEPLGLTPVGIVTRPVATGPSWPGAAILIVFIVLALGGLAAIGVASVIAGAC